MKGRGHFSADFAGLLNSQELQQHPLHLRIVQSSLVHLPNLQTDGYMRFGKLLKVEKPILRAVAADQNVARVKVYSRTAFHLGCLFDL